MTFCSQKRQDGFFWKIWTFVWLGFGKENFFFGKRHFSEIERLIFFKRSHPAFLRSIIAHSKKKIVATHFHHRVMDRLCFGRQGGPVAHFNNARYLPASRDIWGSTVITKMPWRSDPRQSYCGASPGKATNVRSTKWTMADRWPVADFHHRVMNRLCFGRQGGHGNIITENI